MVGCSQANALHRRPTNTVDRTDGKPDLAVSIQGSDFCPGRLTPTERASLRLDALV